VALSAHFQAIDEPDRDIRTRIKLAVTREQCSSCPPRCQRGLYSRRVVESEDAIARLSGRKSLDLEHSGYLLTQLTK
jgi:hypothetical protein